MIKIPIRVSACFLFLFYLTNSLFSAPVLNISTDTINFGEVPLNKTKTLTFTITNTGDATLTGTITPDQTWLTVVPQNFSLNTTESGTNILTVNVTASNKVLGKNSGIYAGKVDINSNGGNSVVNVTLTATCVLAKPNPYNPDTENLIFFGSGIRGKTTRISIYTLSGKLIWENSDKEQFSLDEIIWDGKDIKGRKVLPGIYIYTYESEKEKGTGKFVVK